MMLVAQLAIVVTLTSGSSPAAPPPVQVPSPPLLAHDTFSTARPSSPRDDWFGEDKLRHFFMSFATVSYGYGSARLATFDHDNALTLAIAAGAIAGLGKEIHDQRRGRRFSVKDLVWDAAGIGAGVLLLSSVR